LIWIAEEYVFEIKTTHFASSTSVPVPALTSAELPALADETIADVAQSDTTTATTTKTVLGSFLVMHSLCVSLSLVSLRTEIPSLFSKKHFPPCRVNLFADKCKRDCTLGHGIHAG
jgi:hypothetical protein